MAISFEKARKLLNEQGINTYTMKKTKILGQGTMAKIRDDKSVTTATLETLCKLLNCQPGDLMEYIPDEET